MKNIKILFLFLIIFFGFFNNKAQNIVSNDDFNPLEKTNISERSFYKHDIGVSCGLFAAPIIIPMYHGLFPSLNLSYYYNFNKHHAIGITLSSFYGGVYYFKEYHKDYNFLFEGIILTPQISYRISYCQKKIISLFSAVSLGWKIPIGIKDNWAIDEMATFPAIHVSIIGMRIGNQQDAFTVEIGYGTQGSVILGYTHKFINNKK